MPTHFFHSGMAGAPTNTNAAGSTLAIIDAILTTGFNLQSVLSASVASEVMTVNYAAPHLYEDKVLIRLDGAAGGSIVRRATVTGSQVLTIPAPGFADGAVAGTLSTRVAPADWERVFSDAGKAVFRSKATGPGCTRFYYRVEDAASGNAPRIVRGFESMTDVDTGIGPFPTVAQESGAGGVVSRANSATALPWCAVADGRTVYIFLAYYSYPNMYSTWFGDMEPVADTDQFAAGVAHYSLSAGADLAGNSSAHYVPRTLAAVPGADLQYRMPVFATSSGGGPAYPAHPAGHTTLAGPVMCANGSAAGSAAVRSSMRGLLHVHESGATQGEAFRIDSGVSGISGRVAIIMDAGNARAVAFQIDEDWS